MTRTVFSQEAFSRKQGSLTLEKHSVLVLVACLLRFHGAATLAVIWLCQHLGADTAHKVTQGHQRAFSSPALSTRYSWWTHLTERKYKNQSICSSEKHRCVCSWFFNTNTLTRSQPGSPHLDVWCLLLSCSAQTCHQNLQTAPTVRPSVRARDCELSTVYSWLLTPVFQPWISCSLQK